MVDVADPEQGFADKQHAGSAGRSHRLDLELTEAAGVFLVWSMLVLVEGTIRAVLNSNPPGGLTPDKGFPPLALLVAGVAEVAFGAAGILLAVYILMFKGRVASIAGGFLIFQAVLGWFVFITYVLAVPIYNADRLAAGRHGLSLGQDRFLIIMGMFTSISWCAALQSGQFVLAARCMSMIKGKADTSKMHRLRATVWTSLAMLAGICIFLTGVVWISSATGSSPYIPPGQYPPNVTVYPEMLITAGLLVILWSGLGLAGALTNNTNLLNLFNTTWFLVFFFNLCTFSLAFGRLGPGPAFAAAQHAVLVFAYTVLPVVFTRKMVEWKENGGDDM